LRVSFGVGNSGPFDSSPPLTEYDPDAEMARAMGELKGDAGDAPRYAFLAKLHRYAGDEPRAAEFRKKALDLYRVRVAGGPPDAALLQEMAPVLRDAGLDAEAEKALRQAVSSAPGKWECWSDLSVHLVLEALGTASGRRFTDIQQLFDLLLKPEWNHVPSHPEPLDPAASARLAEARTCADRAVSTAPGKAGPLLARYFLLMGELSWGVRTRTATYDDFATAFHQFESELHGATTDVTGKADLESAVSLESLAFALMGSAADAFLAEGAKDRATAFRNESEELARRAAKHYETLGEGKDPSASAAALASAAMFHIFLEDYARAEADARKSVTLDPAQEQSWRVLVGLLVQRKAFEEMAVVCRGSIAGRDTSFKRLVLAKCLFLTGNAVKAEEEVRVAMTLDPRRLEANLGLAALILGRSNAPRELEEAGRLMARAEETLATRIRTGTATEQNRAECVTVKAVYLGLTGDRAGAAECVRRLKELDPKSRDALEIGASLGL
jgi:tetratricopeptide (TPR) repeat protein